MRERNLYFFSRLSILLRAQDGIVQASVIRSSFKIPKDLGLISSAEFGIFTALVDEKENPRAEEMSSTLSVSRFGESAAVSDFHIFPDIGKIM